MTPFRIYETVGSDGYPPEWHGEIKHLVRDLAGNRCVRCGHPYRSGEHGNGAWSACDEICTHGGAIRWSFDPDSGWCEQERDDITSGYLVARNTDKALFVEAQWRILTVHHLNGDKADCRWWNLASLCQRCHLTIQGRVQLHRVWPWEHSDWFKPYAAGWYAHAYLGLDLTRDEVLERLNELLALERVA